MHKNDSLLFTLSSDVPVTVIDTSTYYYLVKEIVDSYDEANTIAKEYLFKNGRLYENKIAARLYYDQRLNELTGDDPCTNISLQLYLVKKVDNVTVEKYLLLSNDGITNEDAKMVEEKLFNCIGRNNADNRNKTVDAKNSFLDSNYKD